MQHDHAHCYIIIGPAPQSAPPTQAQFFPAVSNPNVPCTETWTSFYDASGRPVQRYTRTPVVQASGHAYHSQAGLTYAQAAPQIAFPGYPPQGHSQYSSASSYGAAVPQIASSAYSFPPPLPSPTMSQASFSSTSSSRTQRPSEYLDVEEVASPAVLSQRAMQHQNQMFPPGVLFAAPSVSSSHRSSRSRRHSISSSSHGSSRSRSSAPFAPIPKARKPKSPLAGSAYNAPQGYYANGQPLPVYGMPPQAQAYGQAYYGSQAPSSARSSGIRRDLGWGQ